MTDIATSTRREFLGGAGAAAATYSAGWFAGPSTASAAGAAETRKRDRSDERNDRNPNRDPLAIHRSTLVVNGLDPSNLSPEYLDMSRRVGIGAWLRAAHQTLTEFATSHVFYDEYRDRIVVARTAREIRAAYAQGKIAQILGWQSVEQLTEDSSRRVYSGPAIINLRAYYEMGLRTCGIAYNLANDFGGGCLEPEKGLTRNGRRLVEEIHKLGILLDVGGHTGEQTSLDALAMSSGVPVVCTHTNIQAINDNPRCTSDRVIEGIARTGGVVGITAASDYHVRSRNDTAARTPQAGLDKHLDQYDYVKKLVGVDHVGLGPDFIFGYPNQAVPVSAAASESVKVPEKNPNWSARHVTPEVTSPQPPWPYIKGFERIDELPNVTRGLIARGWSTAEIRKVLGENWLRVYERVWPG